MILADDAPLYSSRNGEDPVQPGQIVFNPADPVDAVFRDPVKPLVPVYQQTGNPVIPQFSQPNELVTPQTIKPDVLNIVPAVEEAPETMPVIIDESRLAKTFDFAQASQIIDDIKNNIPLPEDTARRLIEKNVVREAIPVETVPPKIQVPLQSVPLKNGDAKKVKPVKGFKSLGLIDQLTDFIYNLIYK